MSKRSAGARRQRGTTLVVALLFLVILSLFAATSFNSSTTNAIVTGNMILRKESIAAAQWLIDETISSPVFSTNPADVAAGVYQIDFDGDGKIDYEPRLHPAPTCNKARPLKAIELDPADPSDVACMSSGVVQNSGLHTPSMGSSSGNSLCANTEWNVRAIVEPGSESTEALNAGAAVAVNQGVGVRVLTSEAMDHCF